MPDLSGIASPVSWFIHQDIKLATHESGSGLHVALTYGRTPHVDLLRPRR